MKNSLNRIWIPLIFGGMLFSCNKKGSCDEYKVSVSQDNESHNFGMNCMECHQSGGKGEGCFMVAGSVKNAQLSGPTTAGQIEFYTEANGAGTLKYTLQIDAKGNFYTSESMNVVGLYPAIKNASGSVYMGSAITTGACNSCHGNSTDNLYAL